MEHCRQPENHWRKKKSLFFVFLTLIFLGGSLFSSLRWTHTATASPHDDPSDIFLPLILQNYPLPPHVVINEVMYQPQSSDLEWVEIYNSTAISTNLSAWQLTNRVITATVTLPDWLIPPGAYLTVYFGSGSSDNDFSDSRGEYV